MFAGYKHQYLVGLLCPFGKLARTEQGKVEGCSENRQVRG
jgi:hypothetical protein